MANQLILEDLLEKPIHIEFSEKNTTSDAGAIFVSSIIKKMQMHDRISAAVPDPRNQLMVTHEQPEQVHQRLLQLSAGYEDLNDSATLRKDPALISLVLDGKPKPDKQEELSSSPTLCRMENRFDRSCIEAMATLQVDLYLERNKERFDDALHKRGELLIVMDLDPTDLETHGQQPFAFFNGHYGHTAYLPLVIVDGENGDLITAIPRPGNRHATWFLPQILRKLFARITTTYPQVKFRLRSDSGFQSEKYFAFLEQHPQVQTATVSIATNRSLDKMTQFALQTFKEADEKFNDPKLIHFGEFGYRADSWSRYRRVVYQISKTYFGATDVRFYMTLDLESTPEAIKLDYNQRADAENRNKEWKIQAFANRVSGETFLVNAFRMLLSGFSFIIMQELQKKLQGTTLEKSYIQTVREKIIKVAGCIQESTRRVLLILPESYPYQSIWQHLIPQTG